MDLPAALLTTLLAGWYGPPPPPLSDLAYLPPRAVVRGWLDFADAHDAVLCGRLWALEDAGLAGSPGHERVCRWRWALRCRVAKWEELGAAADPCRPEAERRNALRLLWWATSWDEYYNGGLAPPAPLEYFEELP
jgi:hypothetical protein